MVLINSFSKMGSPQRFVQFLGCPPRALLAHDYVPPVEADSAYAPQAIAVPGEVLDAADENPSQSSSARRFLAINDRLDDESVDHDAAFGSPSVSREAARWPTPPAHPHVHTIFTVLMQGSFMCLPGSAADRRLLHTDQRDGRCHRCF